MATTTATGINLQGTTAGLTSWAQQIVNTLSAGGWAQTADTGQTAAASLVGPGVVNTSAGYQIWQMQDALQVTGSKVFVKFEFGQGGGATSPSLWITIGTGSDGAGNITGIILARTQISNSLNTTTSVTSYGSAATNRFEWSGLQALGGLLLTISRTKDGAGNDTTDGLLICGLSCQAAAITMKIYQYVRFTNNTLPTQTNLGAFCPSGTTWADGADIGVCPVRFNNGSPSNPCLDLLVYLNGDTPANVSVSVTLYGTAHTFMPLGSAVLATAVTGNANATIMIRYD